MGTGVVCSPGGTGGRGAAGGSARASPPGRYPPGQGLRESLRWQNCVRVSGCTVPAPGEWSTLRARPGPYGWRAGSPGARTGQLTHGQHFKREHAFLGPCARRVRGSRTAAWASVAPAGREAPLGSPSSQQLGEGPFLLTRRDSLSPRLPWLQHPRRLGPEHVGLCLGCRCTHTPSGTARGPRAGPPRSAGSRPFTESPSCSGGGEASSTSSSLTATRRTSARAPHRRGPPSAPATCPRLPCHWGLGPVSWPTPCRPPWVPGPALPRRRHERPVSLRGAPARLADSAFPGASLLGLSPQASALSCGCFGACPGRAA